MKGNKLGMSGAQPLFCQTSVCVYKESNVCFPVWLQPYRSKTVSICVLCSARLVFSASFQPYIQRRELIRSSSGFAPCDSFGKPGSLSDPHRLGAEKPGTGGGFHSQTQETDPGGGEEKTTMIRNPKQVNAAPEPSCHLIKMKWCSSLGEKGGSACYLKGKKEMLLLSQGGTWMFRLLAQGCQLRFLLMHTTAKIRQETIKIMVEIKI